jgi:hypothetical protein
VRKGASNGVRKGCGEDAIAGFSLASYKSLISDRFNTAQDELALPFQAEDVFCSP